MKKTLAIDIISSLLLLLFLYTGISKLADYEKFKNVLSTSPFLSSSASVIAWLLPLTEIGVALLLFFPRTRFKGLKFSLVLLLLLTAYLLFMILYAPELPCNCGGVVSKMSWWQHVWFNLFFIVINVAALCQELLYNFFNFLRKQGMPKT